MYNRNVHKQPTLFQMVCIGYILYLTFISVCVTAEITLSHGLGSQHVLLSLILLRKATSQYFKDNFWNSEEIISKNMKTPNPKQNKQHILIQENNNVCVVQINNFYFLFGAFSYIFLRFYFSQCKSVFVWGRFGTVPFSVSPKLCNVCSQNDDMPLNRWPIPKQINVYGCKS